MATTFSSAILFLLLARQHHWKSVRGFEGSAHYM
jgi:hypothetical protein